MLFHRGRQLSLRRTVLLTGDIVCIAFSIVLSAVVRLGPEGGINYCLAHIPSLLGSLALFLLTFYAAGMYERNLFTRKSASYRVPLVTVGIALMLIVLTFYAKANLQIGRGILLLAGIFVFLLTWMMRYAYGVAVGQGFLSKGTLILGEGKELEDVIRLINRTPDAGMKLIGVVSARRVEPGTFIAGIPVVGTTEKLRELTDAFEAETIIVATSLSREPKLLRLLRPLRCSGTEVMDYVAVYELLAQEIPLDHINDEWLMNAALNSSVIHIRKIKRILDLLVAGFGLLLAAPILLVTAIAVRLDSPGPIFYRQKRSGQDGRHYWVIKFRTMRQDAEAKSGAVWAGAKDDRITRIGRSLRKWRVDEIPQLWNVLKGEMSLVGPRPERPEFIDTLASTIPFYHERLMVPPGVTGWAQVKFPYAASIEAARRKLQYDLYYIKHMSFFFDVLILLRTIRTVVHGLRHSDESEKSSGSAPAPALTVLQGSSIAGEDSDRETHAAP
ncbi:MAG: sugar transferase [Kiritimatiellae bacterium]|nr:sugar transferase [Kiritimatiellia bacterium]